MPTASSSFEIEEVVMKLMKKNDSGVLSFDIQGVTRVGRIVRVTHDVKVDVMRPVDVANLIEPMCPQPNVCHSIPSFFHTHCVVFR